MTAAKAGLESALDFTKFVIALDGALIAFITGATFLEKVDSGWQKIGVIIVLLILTTSLIGGIFVHMRTATMLGSGNYDLNDRHLAIPGMINVVGFALGAAGIGLLAILVLVLAEPESGTDRKDFGFTCTLEDGKVPRLECKGALPSGRPRGS